MTGRLRLVKVVVQPVCVWDDGETLVEVTAPPATIQASNWGDYSLDSHMEDIANQIENQQGVPPHGPDKL